MDNNKYMVKCLARTHTRRCWLNTEPAESHYYVFKYQASLYDYDEIDAAVERTNYEPNQFNIVKLTAADIKDRAYRKAHKEEKKNALVFTDSGRDESAVQFDGGGDCSIRAISFAAGVAYEKVAAVMNAKVRERKFRKGVGGVFDREITGCMDALGICYKELEPPTDRPYRFHFTDLPRGRYVCTITGHAVAVVDKKLYDTYRSWKKSRQVYRVWQIKE